MTLHLKPAGMGAAMGLMMLWMLHDTMMGQSSDISALVVFGGLHLVAFAAVLIAARYASRLSPRLMRVLSKLHRPTGKHVLSMLAGLFVAVAAAHVALHGWIL